MELQRKDTQMLQGLAVLFMVFLHMFCNHNENGMYMPLFNIMEVPVSFYLAQLCDCCVMIFAFCSGYGHSVSSSSTLDSRIRKLTKLYINYWIVIAIFISLGVVLGKLSSEISVIKLLLSIPGLYLFNKSHWYLSTYAILVLLSGAIISKTQKSPKVVLLGSFICYLLGIYLRFYVNAGSDIVNMYLFMIGAFLMTLFEYVLGVLFGIKKWLSNIYEVFAQVNKYVLWPLLLLTIMAITIVHGKFFGNIIISAFSGLIIIIVFSYWRKGKLWEQFFVSIGKHSTNIWLVHMYFTSYYFSEFVFKTKYVCTTYITAITISVIVSFAIKQIQKEIILLFKKSSSKPALN